MQLEPKKKTTESQKANALWAMKADKDRVMYSATQPAKKTFWEGNRQDWSCGKNISKTQSVLWTEL